MTRASILADALLPRIRAVLVRVNANAAAKTVVPETSIVDDLGFDSLRLVHLTLALEEEFEIAEFPMQAWCDREAQAPAASARFTVASLLETCRRCIDARSDE